MIPVRPAVEPDAFDDEVRKTGLRAIAELVGEYSDRTAGRKFKKVANTRDEIPGRAFPDYWRRALGDLMSSSHRLCADLCLYIPRGTGAPGVDHMVAKSSRWDHIYEWSNYRLACSLMNSRKGAVDHVLDPFEIGEGWFALELAGFQVIQGPDVEENGDGAAAGENTIRRLGLRDQV